MVSQRVILGSLFKRGLQRASLGSTHRSVVNAHLIGERSGLPSLHPCGNDRDVVDAAAFNWRIPADRFVALAPEELAASPDIFDV